MNSINTSDNFHSILETNAASISKELDALLSDRIETDEITRPPKLMQAIRYGVLNGGKRLRPFLVLQTASLFDAPPKAAMRVACALEAVHCYSLIHDDLPAMDDDDLRRGNPTLHRAYDEATAILAGDGLLTFAFDLIADDKTAIPAAHRLELVRLLARASGIGGMVGGQMMDLDAEQNRPDERTIITLQAMKTGALLRFACEAGAVIGNAVHEERQLLAEFGAAIGLAFQLADDLLDITASSDEMGKATGKDAEAGKATLVALHGVDWAQAQLDGLVKQAEDLLQPFGERADILRQCASFIARRRK